MKIHLGNILERVIRMERIGISELSRKLKVSRRTLYNWFEQENLNIQIILEIGNLIGHDFTDDLPESLLKGHHLYLKDEDKSIKKDIDIDENSVYFWMNKYVNLLEKYNDLLSLNSSKNNFSSSNLKKINNGQF